MRSFDRKRHLVHVLLMAFIAISASAQYKPGSPVLMWKVSSKTNTAYVLGSVHLGDKSLYPLPSVIENAFAAASILIVEVDMRKVDKQQLQQLTVAAGTYPEGDDLNRHVTPETLAKLNEFSVGYGVPPNAFSKYRPWMVSLTVVMLPMLKAGMNPNDGLDMYFLNKAAGKRVEQLEDAAFQVKLFASFPDKDADHAILHAINQAKNSGEFMSRISSFWSHGQADKLDDLTAAMSVDDTPDEKALSHRLREDRNPHMTERLEKCLQTTSEACFMVVGAAHVIGSEGIVKQLQAHGYRVEQAVVEPSASSHGASR